MARLVFIHLNIDDFESSIKFVMNQLLSENNGVLNTQEPTADNPNSHITDQCHINSTNV